jgi:hypothetical protein
MKVVPIRGVVFGPCMRPRVGGSAQACSCGSGVIPSFLALCGILTGCIDPAPVSSRSPNASSTATEAAQRAVPGAAIAQPMLITTPGVHTSPDGASRVEISGEDSRLHVTRLTHTDLGTSTATSTPEGWSAQPGWFVFIDSDGRVWAYDGNSGLLMYEVQRAGVSVSQTVWDANYPCPVPEPVLTKLRELSRKGLRHEQ